MKKLTLIIISLYLFSCSSDPKQEVKVSTANELAETQISGSASEMNSAETAEQKPVEKVIEKSEVKSAPQPSAASLYSTLNEAIKVQNDDGIQKASSEILTQNSKDVRGLNALALFHYKKGHFEAAQFLLNKAIAANPKLSELYGNLALVQLAKNDRRDAIKTFRKALELNPQDAIAGANLGALYVQDKDYNKAYLSLEIPIKKGLKEVKILNNYAIASVGVGKVKEAAEIYEKLLKENPSQREVMLNYSILLIENMQKNKEGLDLLNRLKFVGAPQEARDTIKNLEIKAKAGLQ